MTERRKTEISLQLNEVVAIRSRGVWLTWCTECRKRLRMIPADEAALAATRSVREIYRMAEAGGLHFREDENGLLYICFESLQRSHGKKRNQITIKEQES